MLSSTSHHHRVTMPVVTPLPEFQVPLGMTRLGLGAGAAKGRGMGDTPEARIQCIDVRGTEGSVARKPGRLCQGESLFLQEGKRYISAFFVTTSTLAYVIA